MHPQYGGDDEGTPTWVKVFGLIAFLFAVLFIVLLLTRSGHGPRQHFSSGLSLHQQPAWVVVDDELFASRGWAARPVRPPGGTL